MSRKIGTVAALEGKQLELTAFAGGSDGSCVQLTKTDGGFGQQGCYVQLTKAGARELAAVLQRWANEDAAAGRLPPAPANAAERVLENPLTKLGERVELLAGALHCVQSCAADALERARPYAVVGADVAGLPPGLHWMTPEDHAKLAAQLARQCRHENWSKDGNAVQFCLRDAGHDGPHQFGQPSPF